MKFSQINGLESHTCGVYKIENVLNNKIYIGQSVDIKRRLNTHKKYIDCYLCNNEFCKGANKKICYEAKKYGIDVFDIQIVEVLQRSDLIERESYWIRFYNSANSGYNTAYGTITPKKLTDEDVSNIIKDLKHTSLTKDQIGEKYGISGRIVRAINTGKSWNIFNLEYPIRPIVKQEYFCDFCGARVTTSRNVCAKCYNEKRLPDTLRCATKEQLRELTKDNSFASVGRMYGVTPTTIRRLCKKIGLPATRKEIDEGS